jgi:hypothetical protein
MQTIWKCELEIIYQQCLYVPAGGQPLFAAMQNDKLCIWFLVMPKAIPMTFQVRIHGTGQPIDTIGFTYLSSVLDGQFAWHVFVEEETNG